MHAIASNLAHLCREGATPQPQCATAPDPSGSRPSPPTPAALCPAVRSAPAAASAQLCATRSGTTPSRCISSYISSAALAPPWPPRRTYICISLV